MRKILLALMALAFLTFDAHASIPGETYSPAQLGCNSGVCQMPDWWMPYKFYMYNGNWGRQLIFPNAHWDVAIDISSNAQYTSSVSSDSNGNTYLSFPFGSFNVKTDVKVYQKDHYIFNARRMGFSTAWMPVGESVRYMLPSRDGVLISNATRMVVFQLYDKNGARDIYLPDHPMSDQLVIIHSEASYASQIHGSSSGGAIAGISKGQTLIYKYSSGSWKAISWSTFSGS